MECISCSQKTNNFKVHNNLNYCYECYELMLKKFLKFEETVEKTRDKIYEKPTKILENIYIGSIDSVNEIELKKLGINNIIIAGKRLKNATHTKFKNLELLLEDSYEQNIISSIDFVHNYIKSFPSDTFLIHCYSGISRSSSILIGYLMKELNLNFEKAYDFLKNKYSKAHPNDNFIKQIKTIHQNYS